MNRIFWPVIIISGKKQSGKDLSALMIKWLLKNFRYDINFTPDFYNIQYYEEDKIFSRNENEDPVRRNNPGLFSFATNLKRILSNILNIPLYYFEDNSYKTNYYINLKTFDHIDLRFKDKYSSDTIKDILNSPKNMSLRELMQNISSYIEPLFGEDVWAKSTLIDVRDYVNGNKEAINKGDDKLIDIPIITDLRRKIELKTIRDKLDDKDYIIIRIVRKLNVIDWLYVTNIVNESNIHEYSKVIDRANKEYGPTCKITQIQFLNMFSACYYDNIMSDPRLNNIYKTLDHETETDLDYHNFEYVIYNDGTKEDLLKKLADFFNKIKDKYYIK